MQLSFLGQSYEATLPTVEAMETGETGTFLGKSYTRKQYTISQLRQPITELTYRGVRYSR